MLILFIPNPEEITLQTTTKWLKNLSLSLTEWAKVPEENVVRDLNSWTCGTQACFGGWVAQQPYFQAQGVRVFDPRSKVDRYPALDGIATVSGVSYELFGYRELFHTREICPLDQEILLNHAQSRENHIPFEDEPSDSDRLSDRDLVLKRLEMVYQAVVHLHTSMSMNLLA
jgi:hypothetical protein